MKPQKRCRGRKASATFLWRRPTAAICVVAMNRVDVVDPVVDLVDVDLDIDLVDVDLDVDLVDVGLVDVVLAVFSRVRVGVGVGVGVPLCPLVFFVI